MACLLLAALIWLACVWFLDLLSFFPWEISIRRDLLFQAWGLVFHSHPELLKLWVWHLRGKLYTLKWRVSIHGARIISWTPEQNLSPSTLKVYVAAIVASSTPLGGESLGRNPLMTRFLCGAAVCSQHECIGRRCIGRSLFCSLVLFSRNNGNSCVYFFLTDETPATVCVL